MKKLSNGMRILIGWIIVFIFISLIVNMYNWYFHYSALKYYQTTNDSRELLGLMEKNPDESELSMQEIYDLFYSRYKDFNDGTFYNGYTQAYSSCHGKNTKCNLREEWKKRLEVMRNSCIKNYQQLCISHILNSKDKIEAGESRIQLFEKSVLNYNYCGEESYQKFFESLSTEDKNKLDKKVLIICIKKL